MDFFTSDTHYSHRNICRGVSRWTNDLERNTRDFITLEAMNDAIIDGINLVVGPNDTLWHLGDVSFGGPEKVVEFFARLNCKNINVVLGNHDKHYGIIESNALSVGHYAETNYGEHKIVMMHYPIEVWNRSHHGSIHLHGHCHGTLKHYIPNRMDVGCDGQLNYVPWSIDQILDMMLRPSIELL